jgi:hypothetical protein
MYKILYATADTIKTSDPDIGSHDKGAMHGQQFGRPAKKKPGKEPGLSLPDKR